MKRVFAVLLIICLICVSTAVLADDSVFTLRGGLHFGMSIQEVLQTEREAGWSYEELTDGTESIRRYMGKGSVAGCKDGRVFFTFLDEKLVQIVYSMESGSDIPYLRTCFTTREKTLEEKYGTTQFSSATGMKMEQVKLSKYHRYIFSQNNDYYSHRQLTFGDQVVCIDHYVDYVEVYPEFSCVEVVYTLYPGNASGVSSPETDL